MLTTSQQYSSFIADPPLIEPKLQACNILILPTNEHQLSRMYMQSFITLLYVYFSFYRQADSIHRESADNFASQGLAF